MITTLCISCNRPALEFDRYQELAADVLSHIVAGVTIIRLINQGTDNQKLKAQEQATSWWDEAARLLNSGNNLREAFLMDEAITKHRDCDARKQCHRRLNGLLLELDFMRRDLIGHFVPVALR